ncbi:hypothetical protein [Streptomyces sp. NPDC126514]|uniref:hypothetical protein n=1 Tax=Streptomyces sp. NPDC126514 TaxID=3155210 RepID=UPI003317C2EE
MSTVRSLRPGRTWLRTFVLLLALCVPAAPAGGPLSPVAAATEIIEYDVVDPAPRPGTARRAHRATALPPPPAPRPRPAALLPPPHPRTPAARRSVVVLRC